MFRTLNLKIKKINYMKKYLYNCYVKRHSSIINKNELNIKKTDMEIKIQPNLVELEVKVNK